MKFFSYVKKDKTTREFFIFIFLLWVLLSILLIIGGRQYYTLYYSKELSTAEYIIQPYLSDFEGVLHSIELFVKESEEITQEEYRNYCDGLCSTSDAIILTAYSPSGIIEYVSPMSMENEFLGVDLLDQFTISELSDFQYALDHDEMFITYTDDFHTMIFHKPIIEHGVFLGIVSTYTNVDLLETELLLILPIEGVIVYNEDDVFVFGELERDIEDYNVVALDLMGIDFFVGVNFYSTFRATLSIVVWIIELGLVTSLFTILGLVYRNQRKFLEYLEHVDYSYHFDLETGLKNKTSLYKDFEIIANENSHFYIAYGIFNNIKFINFKYGHEMGSSVVKEAINLIKGVLRQHTEIYHLGGDEYAFLFKVNNENEIRNIINRILRVFDREILINKVRTNISLSLGVVAYPQEGKRIDELIRNAHVTLNQSKIANSNNYAFYSSLTVTDIISNQNFDEYVSKLDLNLFDVFLMPIVHCHTNKIVGFECLSRAFNEFDEMIDTGSVVSSLERMGRIQELDEIVFRKMLAFMKKINDEFPGENYFLSVNASALSLNEKYVKTIIEDYKSFKLKSGSIILELTESYKVEDHDYLIRLFKELNKSGIRTAIDDFGSGYSSLSYISKFPIYSIKLDKEYVKDYYENSFNRTLFLTLRSIAEVLQCKLIAEGVDDPDTLDFLRENDCELYQGYLYSKGVPFLQAMAMLKSDHIKPKE